MERPADKEIEVLYEEAVSTSEEEEPTPFNEGIQQALGWVLGLSKRPDLVID